MVVTCHRCSHAHTPQTDPHTHTHTIAQHSTHNTQTGRTKPSPAPPCLGGNSSGTMTIGLHLSKTNFKTLRTTLAMLPALEHEMTIHCNTQSVPGQLLPRLVCVALGCAAGLPGANL